MRTVLRRSYLCRNLGFTITELIISVGVVVILAAISVPIFNNFSPSYNSKLAVRDFVSQMQLARVQAIKNRVTTVVVFYPDNFTPADQANSLNPSTGDSAYFSRDPVSLPNNYDSSLGSNWQGAEIWAYIPQNLLPHLRWLPDPDYANINHIYFVDQKPRVFDAQIYEGADTAGNPLNALWTAMSAP